jgi:hypothetical protein
MGLNMDTEASHRIAAIDELISILNKERSFLIALNNKSPEQNEKLKTIAHAIVESGFNRESIQSDKWAGIIVMKTTIGVCSFLIEDMQNAKHILRQIINAGHLKMHSEYSTRRGRAVPVYALP